MQRAVGAGRKSGDRQALVTLEAFTTGMRCGATATFYRHGIVVPHDARNSQPLLAACRAVAADLLTQPTRAALDSLISQELASYFRTSAQRQSAGVAERSVSGWSCSNASDVRAGTPGCGSVESEQCAAGQERN